MIALKPRVLSVQVGRSRRTVLLGREFMTGSFKSKAPAPVPVSPRGLAGDEQADLQFHGGPDKAVCFYPVEHYQHWTQVVGCDLPRGAFGENITTRGVVETIVHMGDTWQLGSAVIQVTAPRRPCWKLGARWSKRELPVLVQATGYTGYYARVLESGFVSPGDPLKLLDRPERSMPISEVNRIMNVDRHDVGGISRALQAPQLPSRWRKTLESRLAGRTDSDSARLYGPGE